MRRDRFLLPFLLFSIISATAVSGTGSQGTVFLPPFTKRALLNGLEIFFLPHTGMRSDFALMIKNGAAFDPAGKWGTTYLMAHLMTEATERRTGPQLREDLESMDSELHVRVDWDAIYFHGSAPDDRLGDVLNVLGEMIVRPQFEEELFEQFLEKTLGEVESEIEKPTIHTQRLFLQEIFSHNPYGHSVRGDLETLKNVTLRDIKIQYRKLVMPNQAQFAVYTGRDVGELFTQLGRRWGSWTRGEAAPFTFRRAQQQSEARILVRPSEAAESLMRFGNLGVENGAPDYYPLAILKQYLTLSLTAWAEEISGDRQIQASVHHEARKMPGFMQLTLRVPPSKVAHYLRRVLEEFEQLREGVVDADRFNEAKDLAFLELNAAQKNPKGRLLAMLQSNLHELGLSYLTNYGLRLDRVRQSHFVDAVQRYFPPKSFLLVVSGPAEELEPQLQDFGSLSVLN